MVSFRVARVALILDSMEERSRVSQRAFFPLLGPVWGLRGHIEATSRGFQDPLVVGAWRRVTGGTKETGASGGLTRSGRRGGIASLGFVSTGRGSEGDPLAADHSPLLRMVLTAA